MTVLEKQFEPYMPSELPIFRVTDIDVVRWASEGVKAIGWDVEGTLGSTGSDILVPEYVAMIHEARDAGIPYHYIRTNFQIKTKQDRLRVRSWEEQAGVDISLVPSGAAFAKPSPHEDFRAMNTFELPPSKMGAVGDKASGDIRAAYFAGIEHRAWTRPIAENRALGDRLVRDPFESMLRVKAHLLHSPSLKEGEETLSEQLARYKDLFNYSDLLQPEISGQADGQDRIVGFGLSEIELDQETLNMMKQPVFREMLQSFQDFCSKHSEGPVALLKNWLYEHGRTTADILTFTRLVMAGLIIAVNQSDLDDTTKLKATLICKTFADVTDAGDGFSSRRHKNGATKKGGAMDQNIDKALSAVMDLSALLPAGTIGKFDAWVCIGRDMGLSAMRVPFKERGYDTKSGKSGKVSTAVKSGAQDFGLLLGRRYPYANKFLQRGATALKIYSALDAPNHWTEAHELEQHQINNLNRLLAKIALDQAKDSA